MRRATSLLLVMLLAGCTSPENGDGGPASGTGTCADATRASTGVADGHTLALVATAHGCIALQLEDQKAPLTVENFASYADEGFYNATLFHRVSKGFMIQGGGMGEDGVFKTPGHPAVRNEARSSGLRNVAYSVAMARTGEPDSATNQFFINHADNTFLDPGPDAGNPAHAGYAVFGTVVSGRDVVDAIANVPTVVYQQGMKCQPDRGAASCPVDPVVIDSIKILRP